MITDDLSELEVGAEELLGLNEIVYTRSLDRETLTELIEIFYETKN